MESDVPGPGNYENWSIFKENIDKIKGTSFFGKYDGNKGDLLPGP